MLDPVQDAVTQITQALLGREGISSLHIVSHGESGGLDFGASRLNLSDLPGYAAQVQSWGLALTDDADILLYGCDVAQGEVGQAFVNILSQLTGADVAASNPHPGSSALGGDWNLEYQTGSIDAPAAFVAGVNYQHTLANFDVSVATDNGTGATLNTLSWAIAQANAAAGADTVTLLNSVRFTAAPTVVINSDMSFVGGGFTVSGDANNSGGNNAGDVRPFWVQSGNVSFNNLTISGGRSQGGNGAGGGAGLGGGLFIYDGNVTLQSVNFSNNQAVGGNGATGVGGGLGGNGNPTPGTAGITGSASTGSGGGTAGTAGTAGSANGTGGNGGTGGQNAAPFNSSGGTGGNGGNGGTFGGGGGTGGNGGNNIAPVPGANRLGGNGGNGGFGGGGGGGGTGGTGGTIFLPGPGNRNGNGGNGGFGGFGGGGGAFGSGNSNGTNGSGGSFGGNGGSTGGGGAGLGGAVFIRTGSLALNTVSFSNNTATGGTGANSGQGKGGAIFVLNSLSNPNNNDVGMPGSLPTVTSTAATFTTNTATSATGTPAANGIGTNQDNGAIFGTISGPPNLAPVLSLPGAALAYTENAAATVIDGAATVSDTDSLNFDTGTLTVNYSTGGSADDRLAIQNQGVGAGQIGVSGANITFGGVTIGSFTGGTGITALVVTFNANATPIATQALLRNLTYANVSDAPTAARTVQFLLTDGDGGTSTAATKTINVTAVNDAPTIAAPGSVTVVEDIATPLTGISFADLDAGTNNVTATFTVAAGSLSAIAGGGVAVSGTASALTLTGTIANLNAFIAASTLRYTTLANSNTPVTLGVTLNDNGNSPGPVLSATTSVTIAITPVNDAPSFVATNPATSLEDAGLQTLTTWASFNPGNAAEAAQTATYTVSAISNASLFSVAPSIASNGTLTYQAAANANGTSTFSVTVRDNGGGTDTSLTQTFTQKC